MQGQPAAVATVRVVVSESIVKATACPSFTCPSPVARPHSQTQSSFILSKTDVRIRREVGVASWIVQIGSVSANMPRVKRTPKILQTSYLSDTDNSLGKNSEGEREHIRINFQ